MPSRTESPRPMFRVGLHVRFATGVNHPHRSFLVVDLYTKKRAACYFQVIAPASTCPGVKIWNNEQPIETSPSRNPDAFKHEAQLPVESTYALKLKLPSFIIARTSTLFSVVVNARSSYQLANLPGIAPISLAPDS